MIEPDPQKLSIRNEDIMSFHKSFFFFAYILQNSPSLEWISRLIVFFTFLQLYVLTLTPLIIEQQLENRENFVTKIFYIFAHLSYEKPDFQDYTYIVFYFTLFLIFLLTILGLIYFAFYSDYRFLNIFISLRGFLFLFSPICCLIPVTIHLGYAVEAIAYDNCSNINIIVTIVFAVLSIFGFLGLACWASPLLLQTPLLSMAHVPSRLLPDLTHVQYSFTYVIMASVALSICNKSAILFLFIFSPLFGIFQLKSIYFYPYTSIFDTIMTLGVSMSMILNPLLAIIPYVGVNFNDVSYFLTTLFCFAIFLLASTCLVLIRRYNIYNLIQHKKLDSIDHKNVILFAQEALLFGNMKIPLVNHIYKVYEKDPSPNLLLLYCYCYILASDLTTIEDIDILLTAISQINTFTWSQQFIAFELYRSFTQTMTLPIPIQRLDKVESLTKKYMEYQEKFWDVMIAGDVPQGLKYIHKMKSIFMEASSLYDRLKQFYKYHPRILQLEISFFMTRRKHLHPDAGLAFGSSGIPINLTCDIQSRYSQFIRQQQMLYEMRKKDDNTTTTATTTLSDGTESRSMTQISNNLHKFLEKPLPFKFHISIIILFLLFVASFSILIFPVFNILNDYKYVPMIPIAFNQMRSIANLWSNLNIGIKHLSTCTEFVLSECDEIYERMGVMQREPDGIQCLTIKDIVDNLGELSNEIHTNLESFSNAMSNFRLSNNLEQLYESWYDPVVTLFPISENDSIVYNTKIDMRSTLVFLTGQIIISNPDTLASSQKCYSAYANYTRSRINLFNVTTSLQILLDQSLQSYKVSISEIRDNYSVKRPWEIYFVSAILIVISILYAILLIYIREYNFYSILKRHFRPTTNPYTDKITEDLPKSKKFKFNYKTFKPVISYIILYFCFLIQFFFMYEAIIDKHNQVMNECDAIIEIGNTSHYVSLELISLIRYFDNKTDPNTQYNLNQTQYELISTIATMMKTISPLQIERLVNSSLSVDIDKCSKVGESNITMHDIISCWPVTRQISIFFYYALGGSPNFEIPLNNDEIVNSNFIRAINSAINPSFDPNDYASIDTILFRYLQHLYMTHMIADIESIASDFNSFSQMTMCEINLFCNIEIGFYAILLFFTLINIIWRVSSFLSIYRQICRIYQVLIPKFIASHQCLMEFIIDPEENEKHKAITKSFFSAYDDAGLSVIVTTDRLMIVTFTHGTQTLFGYRAEQLIGQPLTILIPRSSSTNVSHNSVNFYQRIAVIKKRQADADFTRELLGRSSDGNEIQIQVRVSLAEVDDVDFFVIQCKSIAELYYYDDQIQRHKDVFMNTFASTMPRALFPESGNTDEEPYMVIHYDQFLLMYATFPRPEDFAANNESIDMTGIRERCEEIYQLYSGVTGAIVLDSSCSHIYILYGDYTGDLMQLFNEVWEYFISFFSTDEASVKTGFILGGSHVDVLLFSPPQVPIDFDPDNDPIGESRKLIPVMTVEPYSPIFGDVPKILELLKPNKIIISSELESFIEDVTYTNVQSDLPYGLSMFDL